MNDKTRYELLREIEKESKGCENWDKEDIADALAEAFNHGCKEGAAYDFYIATRAYEADQ